jgi:hypothetical protein
MNKKNSFIRFSAAIEEQDKFTALVIRIEFKIISNVGEFRQ